MKYYKLIANHQILGAISSDNFIYYSPVVDCFLQTTEEKGEYISFNGQLYRATWMQPIKLARAYELVQTVEINEDEYKIFADAIENNIVIETIEADNTIIEPEETVPDDGSLEFIRAAKLKELSYACNQTIEHGFDITLSDGLIHHFSLDTQDQLNLITLSSMAETQDLIPYHADGEICKFYSAAEMKQIIAAATEFKIYHTTYFNALKSYVNDLKMIEAIAAVTYGMKLPISYQSDVYRVITA